MDVNKEVAEINNASVSLTLDESDTLPPMIVDLEKRLFDCSIRLRELTLSDATCSAPIFPDTKGIRLPRLDVTVLNGHVLYWRCFWEPIVVSLNNRPSLSNAEKVVYLQQV